MWSESSKMQGWRFGGEFWKEEMKEDAEGKQARLSRPASGLRGSLGEVYRPSFHRAGSCRVPGPPVTSGADRPVPRPAAATASPDNT